VNALDVGGDGPGFDLLEAPEMAEGILDLLGGPVAEFHLVLRIQIRPEALVLAAQLTLEVQGQAAQGGVHTVAHLQSLQHHFFESAQGQLEVPGLQGGVLTHQGQQGLLAHVLLLHQLRIIDLLVREIAFDHSIGYAHD
jgi:hypothetical protein